MSFKYIKYSIWISLLSFFALSFYSTLTAETGQLTENLKDDSFYYLEISKNVAEGKGVTFDEVSKTNGFHPLWMGVTILLANISSSPHHLLEYTLLTGYILIFISSLYLLYQGSKYGIIPLSLSSLIWIRYSIPFSRSGMEVSLILFFFSLLFYFCLKFNLFSGHGSHYYNILFIGFILSLIQLTRLDSVFFCVIFVFTFFAYLTYKKSSESILDIRVIKSTIILSLPCLFTGSLYLYYNYVTFGEVSPVSGFVKGYGSGFVNYNMIDLFLVDVSLSNLIFDVWIPFFIIIAVSTYLIFIMFKKGHTESALLSICSFAFAATLLSYYLFFTSWPLWSWYSYPAPLIVLTVIPGLKHIPVELPQNVKLTVGVLAVLFIFLVGSHQGLFHLDDPQGSYKVQNQKLAMDMNTELQGRRVAMGDRAGSFAYFYDGPVTQLEGLVGSYDTARSLLSGKVNEVLNSHGVDYVIAWADVPENYDVYELETVRPDKNLPGVPEPGIEVRSTNEVTRRHTPAGTIVVWEVNDHSGSNK